MTRLVYAVLGSVIAVLVGGGVLAWWLLSGDDVQGSPTATADAFLEAWQSGEWEELVALVHGPPSEPSLGAWFPEVFAGVRPDGLELRRGAVTEEGATATARFRARLTVGGLGEWRYEGRLDLVRAEGQWWVDWSPATAHPDLGDAGDRLVATREWGQRGPIHAHDGTMLVGPREVIEVGLVPQRITDRPGLLAALQEHIGADPAMVARRLDAPGVQPDWFVPVTTLSLEEYEAVRPTIFPLPGTAFQRASARGSLEAGFAPHILGRTGEATAEALEQLGEPYALGDVVGLSGLERAFERHLAGAPSGEVQVVDADGEVRDVLHEFEGEAPQALTVTLDVAAQRAADAALAEVGGEAALVAIDPATSSIRAAAISPPEGFNRALAGRYPPGSTFKVVTLAALLESGRGPDEPVDCPPEVSVGGRRFRNAGGAGHGTISLAQSFAQSCNTVFGPLAAELGAGVMRATAQAFGFDAEYELALPVAGGAFPEPSDDTETAAAGIGQGRVEASPLHMATVAGAVASGTWRPPRLIASVPPADGRPLNPVIVGPLQELMRLVVTSGTGTAADVPGRNVRGKTGSAEFGRGDPPPTHAWFIGYDDTLAFAVVVEGAGGGGAVAAPLAARFLSML